MTNKEKAFELYLSINHKREKDYDYINGDDIKEVIELAATPDELPTVDKQFEIFSNNTVDQLTGGDYYLDWYKTIEKLNSSGFYIMDSKPIIPDLAISLDDNLDKPAIKESIESSDKIDYYVQLKSAWNAGILFATQSGNHYPSFTLWFEENFKDK
jgi:hypothetical protein